MKLKARDLVHRWPRGRSMSIVRSAVEVVVFEDREDFIEHFLNLLYHGDQQRMVDRFLEAWRAQPPFDRLSVNYFPTELPVRPLFMETCTSKTLADLVEELKAVDRPIIFPRPFR
jgi:hypothetical protein